MTRSLLLAALALGSATASAAINTQLNGFTFTNGLSTLTDTSALNSTNKATATTYLTDNDILTFDTNIGSSAGGSLQGTFAGSLDASATGVYIIGLSFGGNTLNGGFNVKLLTAGGLTSARSYGDADFISTTQTVGPFDYVQGLDGTVVPQVAQGNNAKFAYLYISFSEFSVTRDQVLGIQFSDFSAQYPDLSYISVGYSGAPAVPEPSTYGLALGGLALAVVAFRRRASKPKA